MSRFFFLILLITGFPGAFYAAQTMGLEGVLIEKFPPDELERSEEIGNKKPTTEVTADPYHFDEPLLFRENYSNLIQVKA